MSIGAKFEYITNLQYKVKLLTSRVQSFESGEKYVSMRSEFSKQLTAKDRKIKKLKSELSDVHCEIVTVRKNWMQVFEDISNEHEKIITRMVITFTKGSMRIEIVISYFCTT